MLLPWLRAVCFLCFLFFLYHGKLSEGRVSRCCQSESCDESCPWKGACANGQDYPCMEELSGYLNCQERTRACQRYDECDDDSAAHRAGNICESSPYFNGGYPMERFRWLSGTGKYDCLEASDNGAYCRRWEGVSSNMEEYFVSSSNCTQSNDEDTLCISWTSRTVVNQKCFRSESKADDGTIDVSKVCCHFGNRNFYKCCSSLCSDDEYTYPNSKIQYESCQCMLISSQTSQPICLQSKCDQYYFTNQTYDEGHSYTSYQCIDIFNATNVESTSSTKIVVLNVTSNVPDSNYSTVAFCQNWMGNMESQETFALSSCHCDQVNATLVGKLGYCEKWSCESKSANYYLPNTLWVLLPGLLGGLPLILTLYITGWYRQRNIDILSFQIHVTKMQQVGDITTREAPKMKNSIIRAHIIPWLFWFLWCGGMTVIAIWKAGLIALFACFIPMTVVFGSVMGWYACQMVLLEMEMKELKQNPLRRAFSNVPPANGSHDVSSEKHAADTVAINNHESIALYMPSNSEKADTEG